MQVSGLCNNISVVGCFTTSLMVSVIIFSVKVAILYSVYNNPSRLVYYL